MVWPSSSALAAMPVARPVIALRGTPDVGRARIPAIAGTRVPAVIGVAGPWPNPLGRPRADPKATLRSESCSRTHRVQPLFGRDRDPACRGSAQRNPADAARTLGLAHGEHDEQRDAGREPADRGELSSTNGPVPAVRRFQPQGLAYEDHHQAANERRGANDRQADSEPHSPFRHRARSHRPTIARKALPRNRSAMVTGPRPLVFSCFRKAPAVRSWTRE